MSSAPHLDSWDHTTRADASARVARLYEKHARMVYGICRAMLRDGHEAEDAAQQTFLLAHRALLGGAHVRNDAAWLATIARNESRTRIAASMRSPLPVSDEDLAAIPTTGDETERSAQLDAIREALADLPERQREAVVLRDLYGLRYGEVAKALGLSRPATEALLFRARRAMRQRLRPVVTTALVVPLSVQEGLAQALPGFTAAGSGGVAVGVAGGGLLAKLTAAPAAAKLATAAVAVTAVGAVGTADSERAARDRTDRPAIVSSAGVGADDDGSSTSGRGREGSGGDDRDASDDSSGQGPGGTTAGNVDRDASGRGAGGGDSSDGPGPEKVDTSGSEESGGPRSDSGESEDDDGSGRDDPVSSDSPSVDDDSEGHEDSSGSSSSGSSSRSGSGDGSADKDSSGHGSGGSGSSGKGSGDDPDDDDELDPPDEPDDPDD